jgi:hypothetical protein
VWGGEVFPFQFPHGRYQTVGCRTSGSFSVLSSVRADFGHGRGQV